MEAVAAAKITGLCVQYSTAVKSANKNISRLKCEVNNLEQVLKHAQRLCSDPNGAKLLASKDILQSFNDCSKQLQDLNRKLKPAKRSRIASALKLDELKWPLESKQVDKVILLLERYKSIISLAFQVDQIGLLQDMLSSLELDKLPCAEGAAFDSFANQLDPKCHDQTRLDLRQQIRD